MTPPRVTTVRATTEFLKHIPCKSTSLYTSTKLTTVFHKYRKFLTSKNTSVSAALSNVDISINDSKTSAALSRSGSLHHTKNGDTFTTTTRTRTGSKLITSLAISKTSKDNKAVATITIIHEPVVTSDPAYSISLNASTLRDIIYSVTKSTSTGSPTVTSSNNCEHTRILEANHSFLNISTASRFLCTNSEATTTKATPTSFPVITFKRSSNSGTRISSAKNTRKFPATVHVYHPIATITNHSTAKDIYSKSSKITPVAIKTSEATLSKNSNLIAASILAFIAVNNSISNTLTSSIPPFIATGMTSPTKTTFSKSNYFPTKTTRISSAAANGFFSATQVSSHSIIKTTKTTVGSDTSTKPIYSSTITPGSSKVVFDTYLSPTNILLSTITNNSFQIIKVPDFSAVKISDSSTYTFRRYTASPSNTFCKDPVDRPIVTTSDIPYASIINAPSMNATDCSYTTKSDALYTASTGSLGIAPTSATKNIPSNFPVTATHTMRPDSMKEPYETTSTYPTVLSYSLSAGNGPHSTTTTNSSMVVLASPTGVSSKEDYTSDNEKVTIPSIIKSEASDTISHSYTSRAATSSTVMYSENSSTAYMHLPTLAHRPIPSDTTISNPTTNATGTLTTTDTLATTSTTTTADTVATIDTSTTTDTVTTTTFAIATTIDKATITDTKSTTETQMTTAMQDNTLYTYKYETLSWLSQSFYYNTKGTTTFLEHTKTRGSTQPSMTSEEAWSEDLESENESDSSTISNSSGNDSPSNISSGTSSTEEVQNIFECPQFITPNDDVTVPDSSRFTYLRILHLPYDVLLDNSIMSTALAQDIPIVFSHALAMSANNFIVISIAKSNSSINNNQARNRSDDPAVIVTMAVPPEVVEPLQTLVSTPDSKLYTLSLGQLPTMIDRTYPVAKELKDFNQLISKEPPSNRISSYAAGTIAGIKYYRQRKSKKEKIMKEQHIMFADSILSPITQSWVPVPYQDLNTRT
ncbi:hypothetical protein INT47_011225 [Mucor saturninus]|uniref:Uncharacterized protein n=1 Tax=Mucor saturninus TaxID=64648 RepID=A0A8H7RNR7_9FUNG|nr:hypothetical protein INT47_011225 [Mucor saturninus]